jgi:hypothetical protein
MDEVGFAVSVYLRFLAFRHKKFTDLGASNYFVIAHVSRIECIHSESIVAWGMKPYSLFVCTDNFGGTQFLHIQS